MANRVCDDCIAKNRSPVFRYMMKRADGRLKWTVDEGFLRAAVSEGCDPPLCHACEKPLLLGQKISLAAVKDPDGDPKNPNAAAIAHVACSGRMVPNLTEWRKRHG